MTVDMPGDPSGGKHAHSAQVPSSPLSPFFHGERVRVRGSNELRSKLLPLTPTSPRKSGERESYPIGNPT